MRRFVAVGLRVRRSEMIARVRQSPLAVVASPRARHRVERRRIAPRSRRERSIARGLRVASRFPTRALARDRDALGDENGARRGGLHRGHREHRARACLCADARAGDDGHPRIGSRSISWRAIGVAYARIGGGRFIYFVCADGVNVYMFGHSVTMHHVVLFTYTRDTRSVATVATGARRPRARARARRRARARAAMPARESSGAPVAFPWLDATYAPVTFAPWTTDAQRRAWVGVFRASAASFERRAALDEASGDGATARARAFARAFEAACARCEAGDEDAREACRGEASGGAWWAPWEGVNCLEMCRARDGILRRCGFADCFRGVKAAENATALRALAGALAATDGIEDDGERLLALVRGVFAGNIFDLGAASSADLYDTDGVDFASTVNGLKPRPWCVDDFDALRARFATKTHAKAIVFVDNAGADVCLGMIPFIRELLRRGTEVVVAANETPSINDVTALEMREQIIPALLEMGDSVLRDAIVGKRMRVVSSGSDMPVIDLRYLSAEACAEAETCDLLVLEGMGRGIETNLWAKFVKIDALKLGMVKHLEVAELLDGELYDCVCKFDVGR